MLNENNQDCLFKLTYKCRRDCHKKLVPRAHLKLKACCTVNTSRKFLRKQSKMSHKRNGSTFSKMATHLPAFLFTLYLILAVANAKTTPRPQGSSTGVNLSPSLTGTPTTTEVPFGYLAPDLDYFNHERDSSEEVLLAPRVLGRTTHNTTYQAKAENSTYVCPPCPTAGAVTSPPTVAATAASGPVDLVAKLEQFLQEICPKLGLRKELEDGAKKKGADLKSLQDHCSVEFTYGYEGKVNALVFKGREDSVTVGAKLQGTFIRANQNAPLLRVSDVLQPHPKYPDPTELLESFRTKISKNMK